MNATKEKIRSELIRIVDPQVPHDSIVFLDNGKFLIESGEDDSPEKMESYEEIEQKLNDARRKMYPTISEVVGDSHRSRPEVKPNPEGYEGLITDIRTQGFATEREVVLIQMVVQGHKPGWFRWNTSTENERQFAFGKQILSELSPQLMEDLTPLSQVKARIYMHTEKGWPQLKALLGQKIRVIVKEGRPDEKNNGKYPNEWIPNPLEHKPLTEEAALRLLASTMSMESEELSSFK